ncbi:hypothetical protein DZC72_09680 [Maribacter algicola]|uniref:Uncharacterized protein n=1 Tax=Maribacter algicola TaxID=2498892 RepID=A0A426RGH9_9FLAO|nr:c-type cytochrome domain-containing protein [Maribacter algicola]RRQ47999.1 hypothetical protein DZC72_09680 [Maribacter algicola]
MQETPDFVLFLGRFHPLVVHLPIGILIFAFFLELLSKFQKQSNFDAVIKIALLLGTISAFFASVLGYMLSQSGDYEEGMLNSHFWLGVATTAVTFLAWVLKTDFFPLPASFKVVRSNIAILTLIVVLISITGHYGGNLTHGSDYLTKYAPFNDDKKVELPALASLDEVVVYPYLVEPVLEAKCYSCHNESKQKGNLAMYTPELLMVGGKHGPILIAGDAEASEMYKRVTLPESDDEFMPPEGKTPLTEEEIAILKFWIDSVNVDFNKTFAQLKVPEEIQQIAANRLDLTYSGKLASDAMPKVNILDVKTIDALISEGFQVRELVLGSSLLDITLPDKTVNMKDGSVLDKKIALLVGIKDNVIRLDMGGNGVTDEHLKSIGKLSNLQQLKLPDNPISDKGISYLKELSELRSVNLYKTGISKASLSQFSEMTNLRKVYAWQTSIKSDDVVSYNSNEIGPEIILGL